MTTHLICTFLVMPYFPGRVCRQFGLPQSFFEITLPWTPVTVSTADEGAYTREMTPWMDTRVIGEEEEEGISLPLYEERFMVVLRDKVTLIDHGEEKMQQLRTACLGEGQTYGEEVVSRRAEYDLVAKERDLITEDLESLCQDFEGMREARDMAMEECDYMRDELERAKIEHDTLMADLDKFGPSWRERDWYHLLLLLFLPFLDHLPSSLEILRYVWPIRMRL
ncbi:hypothetical protein AMTR_s00038p00164880 [Amborella trichopoda]|uniref:Uncharacterized protein n=1 Tax=Amborella trichopoda TaxID=13333 RepID=U5CWT4_AMBTC|nr:hypothetical protein AMTR_s00038p00164880 [Amborella trichopoda]